MRLPRDLSGSDLAQSLRKLGYSITRQTGSHLRLTTHEHGEHHLTIPQHDPLRPIYLSRSLSICGRDTGATSGTGDGSRF
ncbi:MAG: type II toxin-antitoxin system HicA family toxin [Nitrospira sp.]|nr:MAG: type II toxin-antitoxin system HicA family toxin [Nitrospira sp.]